MNQSIGLFKLFHSLSVSQVYFLNSLIVFILELVTFILNSFILLIQNIIESGHFSTGFMLNQAL
nr:MAG TPA: hypothetical protein [Caudoviricetes sp.]